jgi:hypothetical protein
VDNTSTINIFDVWRRSQNQISDYLPDVCAGVRTKYGKRGSNSHAQRKAVSVPLNIIQRLKTWMYFSTVKTFLKMSNYSCSSRDKSSSDEAVAFAATYNVRKLISHNLFITVINNNYIPYFLSGRTGWHNWLRHCGTSRKVAGSIPDGIIGIFHRHNPSGRTVALGPTPPLTKMSIRNISTRVKAASA